LIAIGTQVPDSGTRPKRGHHPGQHQRKFEEYLEIYDEFYADDVEAGSETGEEPIRGKARVRSFIANFLVPLHVMAEIGGLVISIDRQRFREMLQTRRIPHGRSNWSVYPAGRAP